MSFWSLDLQMDVTQAARCIHAAVGQRATTRLVRAVAEIGMMGKLARSVLIRAGAQLCVNNTVCETTSAA
ncbi:hypothetical protein XH93_34410 [Bradyrhizobium sp. CCBAU 51753]|nr:hypothetical protein XH93_34410 [Bradyrhizobium sp. CCBAU 51753]